MDEITLPAFELDCRDGLVAEPVEVGLPEEVAGAPVLAVLSTALVERDGLSSIGAVLSLGLLDDESADRDIGPGVVRRLVEPDSDGRLIRYVVPAPGGRLGLLAEFTVDDLARPELLARVEALMSSFRWAG
jgi:hypothetical protein